MLRLADKSRTLGRHTCRATQADDRCPGFVGVAPLAVRKFSRVGVSLATSRVSIDRPFLRLAASSALLSQVATGHRAIGFELQEGRHALPSFAVSGMRSTLPDLTKLLVRTRSLRRQYDWPLPSDGRSDAYRGGTARPMGGGAARRKPLIKSSAMRPTISTTPKKTPSRNTLMRACPPIRAAEFCRADRARLSGSS